MKQKLFRMTTIPLSLNLLLQGQLRFLNQYYQVTAIADGNDLKSWEAVIEREKVQTKKIPMKRDISIFSDIKSLGLLYLFFLKEKPYIVHTNTPKASLLGMIAAFMAGVPHRIYTVTGLRFEGEKGLKRKLLITMEKITCLTATKVIPEGNGVKQTIKKNKITKKPLNVIGNGNINGIDPDLFNPEVISPEDRAKLKEDLNIYAEDFVYVFVGRLVSNKGISELVKAFTQINTGYQHVKLLLIGPFEKELDPLDDVTMSTIEENRNIILTGFQSDIRPYLAISDVFVFPSYREGFPNVVMQAGAMGLPSVVTDINGCNEIITDQLNGLVIPPRNVNSLKERMEMYLTDKSTLQKHQSEARSRIVSRFSQKDVWNSLLNEYKALD
ncbi:MAG: glycosyltransferase family 4 protein [Tannerella sp.]|nr:glycosyltransferase family 4 protein [Tannerella sp.]